MSKFAVGSLGVVLGLISAGVLGFWVAKSRTPDRGDRHSGEVVTKASSAKITSAPDADSDASLLRQEVARLKMKVAQLGVAESLRPEVRVDEGSERRGPPTPEQVEEAKAGWRVHMAEVSAEFSREPERSGWARTTTTMLHDNIDAHEALRRAVQNVECRSTMCRVQLVDGGESDLAKGLPVFLNEIGGVLPKAEIAYADNADGTKAADIYLFVDATDESSAQGG